MLPAPGRRGLETAPRGRLGHNGSMSTPSLVVLAAGRGTRFGGPKQLVAVRADGATITDVAAERAARAGISRTVVVVSDAVEAPMVEHLAGRASDAVVVRQGGTRGTAQALLAARAVTDGPVLVVNADDVYPEDAYRAAADHLAGGVAAGHAVIGFALRQTLYGDKPQSRALVEAVDGRLTRLREGTVTPTPALTFTPKDVGDGATAEPVRGDALVSMNAMVLQRTIFAALAAALDATDADEVYLPDVVAAVAADGAPVRVLRGEGACHGLTYAEDVDSIDTLV